MLKRIFLFSIIFLGIALPASAIDRIYVTDWYIKDFHSDIVVNKDSSLTITESITADCGNLPDKHGIFRVLPTRIKTNESVIYNPVELISITDFLGNPLKFTTIKDPLNHTITWKIGDPKITVKGENRYRIKYKVKNAIRFDNSEFDELYWNLNGNFWEIETDYFEAMIFFPQEISKENAEVEYYTGIIGSKEKNLANYEWSKNILHFWSTRTMPVKQGITVSVALPKNIFTPYKLGFFDKYDWTVFLYLLPILVFIYCFRVWKKHGDDPGVKKTIIPEFEIPEGLSPIQIGGLITNCRLKNKFTTATIIDLAVKGFISIEETKKGFLKTKDYIIKLLKEDYSGLLDKSGTEKAILDWLFLNKKEITLSDIRKEGRIDRRAMYSEIRRILKKDLTDRNLITEKGLLYQVIFFGIGIVILFAIPLNPLPVLISGLMMIIFSFIMPKRTMEGAELLWRVKGFKLYMDTAEKYRQQFNEKENIFEKLLPYAIIFGITKEWAKKMKDIYGEEYFKTHIPVWYIGANMAGFDVDSFGSALSELSSSISSSIGQSSGVGGHGGAGGGGGGGGGGGW